MSRGKGGLRLKLELVPGRADKAFPAVRRLLLQVLADVYKDGGQEGIKSNRKRKGPPGG